MAPSLAAPQVVKSMLNPELRILPSSPEPRPSDLHSPVPEADKDEASSQPRTEPTTSADGRSANTQSVRKKMAGIFPDVPWNLKPFSAEKELESAAGLPYVTVTSLELPLAEMATPNPPTPNGSMSKRPPASLVPEKVSRRTMSKWFSRRTKSQSVDSTHALSTHVLSSHPALHTILLNEHPRTPSRRISISNSGNTTRSNTPPGSMADTLEGSQQDELRDGDFLAVKKNRASTGYGLRDRLVKHKIAFAPPVKDGKRNRRDRATSLGVNTSTRSSNPFYNPQVPERQIWGMAADAGTGLKARRLSLSLPDDFMVDVAELYAEYQDQSKLGRRGKSIGKGATANVRLMNKKGASAEVFAVKEFRGKSSTEKADDYEQKVKSEFSIAKSAHHPNIVETFRLCNYNGRWNHVMEFCDQGDLFSLVSQKYLSQESRLSDRLCLFKQLVQGLNYLHSHGIAHRDIKLENLLITKDSKLKITDFGVSEVFTGIHPGLRSAGGECGKQMGEVRLCAPGMCGSPPYVAPEVITKKGEYDPRPLDVWGAAIVMLCMTAGGVLWPEAKAGSSPVYDELIRGWSKWNDKHAGDTSVEITDLDYPHVAFFDQHIKPPALRRILLTMLNPDPERRILISMVAKKRWFENIECCQVDSYDEPKFTIDVSKPRTNLKNLSKMFVHNHLPPSKHHSHHFVRLPGSTDM